MKNSDSWKGYSSTVGWEAFCEVKRKLLASYEQFWHRWSFKVWKKARGEGNWGEERIDILANCHKVPHFDCLKCRNLHCRSTFHKCGICAVLYGSVGHPVTSPPKRTGFEFKLARVGFMLVLRLVLLRVILLSPPSIFRQWSLLILHSYITDGM